MLIGFLGLMVHFCNCILGSALLTCFGIATWSAMRLRIYLYRFDVVTVI
jgi:hypothetical protein